MFAEVNQDEQIDIKQVLSEIDETKDRLKEVDEKLNTYLKELGYID